MRSRSPLLTLTAMVVSPCRVSAFLAQTMSHSRPSHLRSCRFGGTGIGTTRRTGPTAVRMSSTMAPAAEAASETAEATKPRTRVLSGVQPTGRLTLGNYLGAIRQWVGLQDDYDTYFCVVDLHAITAPHDPKQLREETLSAAAVYLAAGVDPAKSKIFVQSHVRAHSELCWLLNTQTPMSWLERMIQYKEKAVKQGDSVGVGLFDYPVLMAADILLYQAGKVPVGEDQRQHLELTRDIARRFNDLYAKKVKRRDDKPFREPEALIVEEGARVMSLLDGTSKMSKSAENDGSRINLLDPPATILKKVKKCKTDNGFEGIEWDNPERPEATNLLTIYQAVTGKSREEITAEVADMQWGQFKPLLGEAIVAHLEPIQSRYHEIMADPAYLHEVLRTGAAEASLVADGTLAKARKAMGFLDLEDLE